MFTLIAGLFLLVLGSNLLTFLLGRLYEQHNCRKLWQAHADTIRTQAETIKSQREIIGGLQRRN